MDLLKALPSAFTAANLVIGFVSVMYSISGEYTVAALLIIASLLMDGLDGKIARKLNADSEFGTGFDSLADIVAFGVAPAVLAVSLYFQSQFVMGTIVASAFVLAGGLRLARYNVLSKVPYFVGLPIPAAGVTLAAIHLSHLRLDTIQIAIVLLFLSLLMVSRIKYPNFNIILEKPKGYFRKHAKSKYFALFLVGLGIIFIIEFAIDPSKLLLVPLLYYVIVGPIVSLKE